MARLPRQRREEASARLVVELASEEEARVVGDSIAVDNEGWVEQRREGRRIIAEARAAGIASLRRTVDDFLAAAGVAVRARGLAAAPTDPEEDEEEAD